MRRNPASPLMLKLERRIHNQRVQLRLTWQIVEERLKARSHFTRNKWFVRIMRQNAEIGFLREAIEYAHSQGFEWPSDPLPPEGHAADELRGAGIMNGRTTLSKDTRLIKQIERYTANLNFYCVGMAGVTAIVAYDEKGERDYVPWLAVYQGSEILVRVSAQQFTIIYDLK